jgi:hypothetical protein
MELEQGSGGEVYSTARMKAIIQRWQSAKMEGLLVF